jgi:hypothetical protein
MVYPMMPVGMQPLPIVPPHQVFWQMPQNFQQTNVEIDPETGLPKNPQKQQEPVRYIAVFPYPPPK